LQKLRTRSLRTRSGKKHIPPNLVVTS
jgi:hypothetical protein